MNEHQLLEAIKELKRINRKRAKRIKKLESVIVYNLPVRFSQDLNIEVKL